MVHRRLRSGSTAPRRGSSAIEEVLEERLHVGPGALVRFLLVAHIETMGLVGVGAGVGETMLGAGQADEAVIGTSLVHLGLEVADLLFGDHAVGFAMFDQDSG